MARNKVTSLIRSEKAKWEKYIIEDTRNPKRLQSYCRTKMKNRKGISNVLNENGLETCSDLETAEAFNRFYESVFTIDNGQDLGGDTSCFKQPEEGFSDFIFNPEDVFKVLTSLVAVKASGPDEVYSALLKNRAE